MLMMPAGFNSGLMAQNDSADSLPNIVIFVTVPLAVTVVSDSNHHTDNAQAWHIMI